MRSIASKLHLELATVVVRLDQGDIRPVADPQRFGCESHVTKSRGESDPWYSTAKRQLESIQERLHLAAAFGSDEAVQLVDDNVLKAGEENRKFSAAEDEHRFEGLRCNQEGALWILEQPILATLGHVAVPGCQRQLDALEKGRQSVCLIVDQRFERADTEAGDALPISIRHPRRDRKKRGLRLTASGRG
jgi:hypothetical protein